MVNKGKSMSIINKTEIKFPSANTGFRCCQQIIDSSKI